MIAACPECRTQYRVDPQRLSDEGVRLRCTSCQTIFRVRAPQAAPAPVPAPAPVEAASNPASPRASESQAPTPTPPPGEWTPLSERLVLVATPDAENAKRWVEAIQGWGLEAESAHDGVEAILKIHRRWPAVVVLDPQLPKMFGFQVCEVIKRNDTLRRIGVVLVGAIHHPQRYRRAPTELYGADAYVEEPDMPEALPPILRDLGMPIGPAPLPVQAPAETPAAPPKAPLPVPEAPTPAVDAPTLPPPVPAEATLPPLAVQPQPEFAVASPQPERVVAPPPVPEELTIPPPDLTLPPVVAEPESVPISVSALPVAAPEAVAAPLPVAEPAPERVAPVLPDPGPAIGSPEYDVVDPDDAPSVAPEPRFLVSEPEPTVAASPPPPAADVAMPESAMAPTVEPVSAPTPEPAAVEAEALRALEPMSEPEATSEPEPTVEPAAAVDPEVEQAERLARIIVSDVVLYNEEKFRAACEAGNLLEALEGDMADGRAHFASRVPEHVRNARDFLADELMRLARSRGLV